LNKAAQFQTEEVIGTIVDHMRFDLAELYPDDPFLQRAKELGVSHLIKKIKRRPVIAGFDQQGAPIMDYETEIEGYGSLEAAKHLTKVFGLEQLPAANQKVQRDFDEAVERVVQTALDAGSKHTPEQLRANAVERLRSLYPLVSDANN
jgi:hypothetical protein